MSALEMGQRFCVQRRAIPWRWDIIYSMCVWSIFLIRFTNRAHMMMCFCEISGAIQKIRKVGLFIWRWCSFMVKQWLCVLLHCKNSFAFVFYILLSRNILYALKFSMEKIYSSDLHCCRYLQAVTLALCSWVHHHHRISMEEGCSIAIFFLDPGRTKRCLSFQEITEYFITLQIFNLYTCFPPILIFLSIHVPVHFSFHVLNVGIY